MTRSSRKACLNLSVLSALTLIVTGCQMTPIDVSQLQRPDRPGQLEAYDAFVGQWTWEATMGNAEGAGKQWHGTAEWNWTLDKRVLEGKISAASGSTEYEAKGFWSWHPTSHRYIWSMINNWGYPQSGKASYDQVNRRWRMDYVSVGLDGTTSFGRHILTVTDSNTIDWNLHEWADPLHLIPKMSMTGVYKRKR